MSIITCINCGQKVDTKFDVDHEKECIEQTDEQSDSEMWEEYREIGKNKKLKNLKSSLKILDDRGIKYKTLNESVHYRIDDWDFWPTTGKFYNKKTGEKGRGVFNLIKKLNIKK